MLIAVSFVIAIGFGILTPALPTFARSFDVSVTAVSAVIRIFALTRLLFVPASAATVDPDRRGQLDGRSPRPSPRPTPLTSAGALARWTRRGDWLVHTALTRAAADRGHRRADRPRHRPRRTRHRHC